MRRGEGMAGVAGGVGAARRWSWVAPLLCAVHCLTAPGLVLAGTGVGVVPESVERAVMAVGLVVGGVALRSGLGSHGRRGPAVVGALGAGLWLAGDLGPGAPGLTGVVRVAGALSLLAAMLWNARLHRRVCVCPACEGMR